MKDLRKLFIDEITETLEKLDPETECLDELSEYPQWLLLVGKHHIDVVLADSESFEGTPWDEGGFNIAVTITNEGGEILGTFCPYNYTSQVWTRNANELAQRIRDALDALENWLEVK